MAPLVFFTDGDSAGLTGDTVSGSGTNLYEYKVGSAPGFRGTLPTDLTGNDNLAQVDGARSGGQQRWLVHLLRSRGRSRHGAAGRPHPARRTCTSNTTVRHTTFIATLNGNDGSDWNSQLTPRVTPDGTHLAFNSVRS